MENNNEFKLWSDLNPEVKKELKPDLGFRDWNSLMKDDKYKIWKYLERNYFFNPDKIIKYYPMPGVEEVSYEFSVRYYDDYEKEQKKKRILNSINQLNDKYKVNSYAINFLKNRNNFSACQDFYDIFINQDENVVIELLSFYCKNLISEKNIYSIKKLNETDQEYQNRMETEQKWKWKKFDDFAKDLNDIFIQFGINLYLTRLGFIPRQEEKIIKEIYEPVLNFLSHPNWEKVNTILSDSFDEYRKNTPQGYSNSVTNAISAVQAFLQIIVTGKTGKGEISELISDAQKNNLIPNDFFTKKIFENIKSILVRERQETGIAHPKKEYATEKNARIILNLVMVFLQHCIQK
jgi:hypothetical protein